MSGKAVVGSIIGAVICSVLIMGGLLYFIGPVFLPGLTEQDTDLQNEILELEDQDLVLQYQYQEWDSDATISDYNVTYTKMNETELSITIQENSQLFISFSSTAKLWLNYFFTGEADYSIALVVEGVGNRTFSINHFDMRPTPGGWYTELTYNLNIDYFTGPLSAGTYTIAMYWKSVYDTSDYTYLSVARIDYDNIRSLWVQELKSL